MRLIRYTTDETPRVGVAVGEAIHPVEGTIAELLRLTAADMTARLQEAVRATDTVAMSDVRLLAPVRRRRGRGRPACRSGRVRAPPPTPAARRSRPVRRNPHR